ncbi:unnamed protein product [Mucor fragilis]
MAYERNTAEGIRLWLTAEVSSPGWNSASIAKGLTEDVVTIITPNFSQFDSRVKQGVLLATMCMRKGDLMLLGDNLNKVNVVSFYIILLYSFLFAPTYKKEHDAFLLLLLLL